jgi:predicted XRE-type DNA-binding protein
MKIKLKKKEEKILMRIKLMILIKKLVIEQKNYSQKIIED